MRVVRSEGNSFQLSSFPVAAVVINDKNLLTEPDFYIQPLGPSVPIYPKLYELYEHESCTIITCSLGFVTSLGLEEVWEVDAQLFQIRDQIPRSRDARNRKPRLHQVHDSPSSRLRVFAV